jgi:hypothetical protein
MACVPQCVLPACGDAHVSADTEAALAFLKRNAPLWTQDGKQMLYRPVAMRLSKDCTALKWQGARGWRDAYGKRLVAPHISWLGLYRLVCSRVAVRAEDITGVEILSHESSPARNLDANRTRPRIEHVH